MIGSAKQSLGGSVLERDWRVGGEAQRKWNNRHAGWSTGKTTIFLAYKAQLRGLEFEAAYSPAATEHPNQGHGVSVLVSWQ